MSNTFSSSAEEMRERFERDGFLVFENFVSAWECDRLKDRMAELVAAFDPAEVPSVAFSTTDPDRHSSEKYFLESGDKIRFFFEEGAFDSSGCLQVPKEKAINKVGHALHDLAPRFSYFSRNPALAKLAADLGIKQPLLLQSMYIFKQPKIGGEVAWHQDSTYLYTEPMSVIGFWFALEDATKENGALMAKRGGHKSPLRMKYIRQGDKAVTERLSDMPWPKENEEGVVTLEVPKGSLIVLHGLLPHASTANRSHQSRQAYTLHVIDGAAHYQKENWLQRSADMPLKGFEI